MAGAGMVIRRADCTFVAARAVHLGVASSALCAEALAWRAALEFIHLWG